MGEVSCKSEIFGLYSVWEEGNDDYGFADNHIQDMRESACLSWRNKGVDFIALLSAQNGATQSWCSLSSGELGYLIPGSGNGRLEQA